MSIVLTTETRAALRRAIKDHPKREASMIPSNMTKAELLAAAEQLGIDVQAAIASGVTVSPTLGLDAATDTDTPADTTNDAAAVIDLAHAAADPVTPADPTDAKVSAVLEPLGKGDFDGFKKMLRALADEASRPIIVQAASTSTLATLEAGTSKTARELFGNVVKGTPAEKLKLSIYSGERAPKPDQFFEWPDYLPSVLCAWKRGRNVMLTGPAGTGKTSLGQEIAARTQRPFFHIACNEATDAPTLIGQKVPEGTGTAWKDGLLTRAIRTPGAVVLIDEPSTARPGALMVLQNVLADTRALTIDETGEHVPVAPGVVFILCDNTNGSGDQTGQYTGTATMNRATLDRCAYTYAASYPSPDTEARILVNKTGCTQAVADLLVKFANTARADTASGKLSGSVGLRRLLALAEHVTDGIDAAFAYQVSVLNTAAPEDVEHLRQLGVAMLPEHALIDARDNVAPASTDQGRKAQKQFGSF